MAISEVAAWRAGDLSSRLLLPPIQRTTVWSHEQIVRYWDSLLRGYPAGTILVHRARGQNARRGRDIQGHTRDAAPDDFHLFDGQQRINAILLGFANGDLAASRKLWVDVGKKPPAASTLRFQLRVSSAGQPFGYRPDAPNQKLDMGARLARWTTWLSNHPDTTPRDAFVAANGRDIIGTECAVPLSEVLRFLRNGGVDAAVEHLRQNDGANREIVEDFVQSLSRALEAHVVVVELPPVVVATGEDYVRLFERLGQGGTRLTDEELVYSVLKHHCPELHDAVRSITVAAGRIASEVDLVLGALRVAKVTAPWPSARDWEIASRPTPSFVSTLDDPPKAHLRSKFMAMILPPTPDTGLAPLLRRVRDAIAYDRDKNPAGLPAMLLARLPRGLFDVALLCATAWCAAGLWCTDAARSLRAFALYWLIFVADDDKAAFEAFRDGIATPNALTVLATRYEQDGIARHVPTAADLDEMAAEVERRDHPHVLRQWAERFVAADRHGERRPGEAVRVLSTHDEVLRRALMWLQREYLAQTCPNYDPTSGRDEDLPVDLDHLIPRRIFDFDWRRRGTRIAEEAATDTFRWQRSVVGNSIGNYRWLAASENRRRGAGELQGVTGSVDLIDDRHRWNALIRRDDGPPWAHSDIAEFQRLIDLRTLAMCRAIVEDEELHTLVSKATCQ